VLTDVLHDVRLDFGDGAALKAPGVQLFRGLFGPRSIRAPKAQLSLGGDPLASSSLVRRLVAASPPELEIAELSVDYRHRSLGHLALQGVERTDGEGAFVAKRFALGRTSWSGTPFSFETHGGALEVRLGAAGGSQPRATATYMVSDGRAAEWILEVPYQSFAALGRSLGAGSWTNDDPSRITGTVSWVVPDDPALAPSGSFHFVIDRWDEPPWPEASALTGSSGSGWFGKLPVVPDARMRARRIRALMVRVRRAMGAACSGYFRSGSSLPLAAALGRRGRCGDVPQHVVQRRILALTRFRRLDGAPQSANYPS
jgi:hypothetical protein